MFAVNFDAPSNAAIFESNRYKLVSSVERKIRTWRSQDTYSPADWMTNYKPTELSRIKLKTGYQQPVPKMSEYTVNLTSLPFGFSSWLWQCKCLLLLIQMLWHRQDIFESKGEKSSSSAECRIRNWKSQDTYSPTDWMPTHTTTELSMIKQKLELNSPYLWWVSIKLIWLCCSLTFAPGYGDIQVFFVNFDNLAQASDIRI